MLNIILHKDPNSNIPPPQFLTLPVSRYDTLDACAKLHIDDPSKGFIEFGGREDMPHLHSALKTAGPSPNYFNELNFLAYRLNEISPDDRFIMNGLLKMHSPDCMADLINMTYNLENVMVAGDIENGYHLGKFLVDNDFVEFPEEVIPYLDFAKIGAEHLSEHTCCIDRGVYFEDQRDPEEMLNVEVTWPEHMENGEVFQVAIRKPEDADDSLFAELSLPATDEEINDALEFIGVPVLGEEFVSHIQSSIADFDEVFDYTVSFEMLNDLADQIAGMDDVEYIKYRAVLEHEQVLQNVPQDCNHLLQRLCEYTYRMDDYTFMPKITADSIGSYGYISLETPQQELTQSQEPEESQCPQLGGM